MASALPWSWQPSLRLVSCKGPGATEQALLAQVLLAEREAATVVLLPVTDPSSKTQTATVPPRELLVDFLGNCVDAKGNSNDFGFCEREGWRAVTVQALACFGSEDEGIRFIY